MSGANLTNEQRTELVWFLQQSAKTENKNGLRRGTIESAAAKFNCAIIRAGRIWTTARQSNGNADSKIKGRSGRKKMDRAGKLETLGKLPLKERQTLRQVLLTLLCLIPVHGGWSGEQKSGEDRAQLHHA